MARERKYSLPNFMPESVTQQIYDRWLHRKACAHFKRDKGRGNRTATRESYKIAIHQAILDSGGRDEYIGLPLDWSLIGKYNNDDSKNLKRAYREKLAFLPTVDHVGDGVGEANFKICGLRVNDAKNDLSYVQFVKLCQQVLAHFERKS